MQFIRARIEAKILVSQLLETIQTEPSQSALTYRGWALIVEDYMVEITPRRIRALDSVNLYHDGAEVWLPVLQRIRLRNALRYLVIQRGQKR